MKKLISLLSLCICVFSAKGQITLEYCQQQARANYPLIKQYNLIEQSKEYTFAQIHKAYLPQLSLQGKAGWQSDVTKFPDEFSDKIEQMMGAEISFPSQDQYSIALELSQIIWDGGMISSQKKAINSQNEIEKQSLEVNLYALRKQVDQLFFAILLIDEQLLQIELLQKELDRNYNLILSYIDGGLAQQSDQDEIRVEILSVEQRKTEMNTSRKAYINMLSAFIGKEIGATTFIKPSSEFSTSSTINRPELKMFDSQIKLFETQNSTLWNKGMPKIALFARGAYANPGLNMFKSGFTPYFMGGVQLAWNFGGLYSNKDEQRFFETQKQKVEVQREVFLFNTQQEITQKNSEIEKLQSLLKNDDEIIRLRESIQKTSEFKVENGALSVSDLMRDIHAANMARQTKSFHEIQLLHNIWEIKQLKMD